MQNVREVYDKIAGEWNAYKKKPLPAFQFLLEFANGGVCLDAGTGNGRHLPLLSQKYAQVYAIDNSQNLLEIAKKNNRISNVTFQFGDVTALSFAKDFFDDVYAIAVPHHLSEDNFVIALREFHRVLRPGGLLLATVWNKHQEKFAVLEKSDYVKWKMKNGEIVKRFVFFADKEDVEKFAGLVGFEVVEIFYEKKGIKVEKTNAENLCFVLRKPK